MKSRILPRSLMALASLAWLLLSAVDGAAQTDAPAQLSYGVGDVLKLSQAKIGNDTIIAYIENSGTSYNLTAPEIVYLKSQGVSDPVVTTMLNQRRKLTEAFARSQPPAAAIPSVNAGASAPQYVANYTPPATTYVQPASTVYVIPNSSAYNYNYPYYGYAPYYGGYYGYSSYYPGWSLSVGFGSGCYGGYGYYGGGYCGTRYYGSGCYNGGNYNRACNSGGAYYGAPYRGGNYQGANVQTASYRGGGAAYTGNSGGGYRTAGNFSGGARGGSGRH